MGMSLGTPFESRRDASSHLRRMIGDNHMGYRVGIDVGGTFTDFALYDESSHRLSIRKVLTTSNDPSIAVLRGLDDLTRDIGINVSALTEAIHATTVATNTV